MLARLTQIDYDRQIALTALDDSSENGRMFGIARIITDPDGKTGKFSILIGDP
ncbi:MAG: hypothetical protein AB1Z38_09560 [Desulfotignum sp.]